METSDPLLTELARWLEGLNASTASKLGELLVALGQILRRRRHQSPDTATKTTAATPAPPELTGQDSGTSPASASSPPDASGATTPPASPRQPTDRLYVEWLLRGKPGARFMTQQEVEEFLFVNDFELIFDEPRNLLKFRKGRVVEETYLHELPRRVTELLWLAFTHVGLFLSHPEMAERFDSPKSTAPSRSNLIHVSRCRLAKVLPANLCNRIFGKGRNHGYMIRVYGWSFCWIRLQQSRESSCLIYR